MGGNRDQELRRRYDDEGEDDPEVEESGRLGSQRSSSRLARWVTSMGRVSMHAPAGASREILGGHTRLPPAWIRSLEIADRDEAQMSQWNGQALKLSWFAHVLCLLPLLVEGLQFVVSQTQIHIAYGILLVSTVIMVVAEIAMYTGNILKPGMFLVFQVVKAVGWTSNNWRMLHGFFLHWTPPPGVSVPRTIYLVAFGAIPVVSWASFAYAFVKFTRERRRRQSHDRAILQGRLLSDDTLSHVVSSEVNQDFRLKQDCPIVMRMLNWLNISLSEALGDSSIFTQLRIWVMIAGKYLLVSLLGGLAMVFTDRMPGEPKYHGQYGVSDPARFRNWDYPKVRMPDRQLYHDDPPEEEMNYEQSVSESNVHLQRPTQSATSLHSLQPQDTSIRRVSTTKRGTNSSRLLGPRYLCFLKTRDASDETESYVTARVEDWIIQRKHQGSIGYVFISYTRRQFCTQIWNDPTQGPTDTEAHQTAVARDKAVLTEFGIRAAKAASVPAFWIDFECVQPEEDESSDESMEDVYRICDVVRAAHSLVIVLAPPREASPDNAEQMAISQNKSAWLHDWGRRLWTVPEALLSPSEHRIAVYTVNSTEPELIAKRNFASRAYYDDVEAMQQLMDHYESSLLLTPLQFISLALECLQRRQTEKRMAGDVAYALMGLLRQRPKVNKLDSDFQAFARLSLANDSDRLLERLLCLVPRQANAPWYDLDDIWFAKLWDVDPLCQIAGVADKRTVILGGVFGTTINWICLEPVDFDGSTTRKVFTWMYIRQSAVLAFFFTLLPLIYTPIWYLYYTQPRHSVLREKLSSVATLGIRMSIFVWSLFVVICLFIPAVLLHLQQGKIFSSQARFFGVEGRPDLREVERILFGAHHARLAWTRSLDGPTPHMPTDPACSGSPRRFTLIDTLTLTATVFHADAPPAAVMACGRERGMLRALLCSYDWNTHTFKRETTLRMEAVVLERMQRMDRLRFAVVT